jgi:chromosome segregation ATPase
MKLTAIQQATFPTRWAGCEASVKKIFEQLGHEKSAQAAWDWAQNLSAEALDQDLVLPPVLEKVKSDAPVPYRKLGKVRQFSEELVASHAQFFPAIQELQAHSEQTRAAENDRGDAKKKHRNAFDRELNRKDDLQSRLQEKKRRLEEIPGKISTKEKKSSKAQVLIDWLKQADSKITEIIRTLASAYTPHLITRERTEGFKADLRKCGDLLGRGVRKKPFTQGIEGVQKLAETQAVMVSAWARWMLLAGAFFFLNGWRVINVGPHVSLFHYEIFDLLLFFVSWGLLFFGFMGNAIDFETRKEARKKVRYEYRKFGQSVIDIRDRLETKGHDYRRELKNLREEHDALPGEIAGLEGKIERFKHEFITLQCAVDAWPLDPKYPRDAKFPDEEKVLNSLQSSLPTINAAAKEARGNFSRELKKMKGRLDRS